MGTQNTAKLKSHAHEYVKQYMVYDGSNRMTDLYTAYIDAADGESCMRTQYEFDGSSARIVKRKESNSTWDSSWEI